MVMSLASSAAIITGMVMRGAQYGALGFFGRRSGSNGVPAWLLILVISVFVYIASFLAIKLLSRYRELAADRAGAFLTGKPSALKTVVPDRPGHDRRYLLDATKIRDELGWSSTRGFEEGLAETVAWYEEHRDWWEPLKARAPVEETAWR